MISFLACTIVCGPLVLVIMFIAVDADVVRHQGNNIVCELSAIRAIVSSMMSIDVARAHGV